MARFKMQKINVDQFAILANSKPGEPMSMTVDFESRVAKDVPVIELTMKASLMSADNALAEVLQLTCIFDIHPNDFRAMESNGKLVIPASLLSHIAMHVVGTARGVLFCKNVDSILSDVIMPQVNVAEIFNEDLVIE